MVKIAGKQTASAISRLPGFEVFEIDDPCRADVNIRTDADIPVDSLSGVRPLHRYSVLEIDHCFSSFRGGYILEMRKRDGNPVVTVLYDLQTNESAISACDCEMSLKFAVWVAYSFVAVGKNILPVHASAVVKNDRAVLFLGESGTGKSTHSRLWMEYIEGSYLLNDDCPLVRVDGNRVYAYGSPWSGKVHCYRQEAVPVKAMVRLRQGPENKIRSLKRLSAIGALYPSCPPLFAYDERLSGGMLDTVDKIVTVMSVCALECRPDQDAAEVAYREIFR